MFQAFQKCRFDTLFYVTITWIYMGFVQIKHFGNYLKLQNKKAMTIITFNYVY